MTSNSVAINGWVPLAADTPAPRDAVESAFEQHARGLYRYFVVRTGDAHLADDLMQQLWIQARGGNPPHAIEQRGFWLIAVARNLLRAHRRREQRRHDLAAQGRPELARQLADRLGSEPLAASELERKETRDQLLLALTQLPGPEQELIVGRYFQGRSLSELAAQCGASERAIEGRLYRARHALREALWDVDWE